ncbi:MAG: M48 family metallopeptidase [Candidatus Magasanikbacteria bacterium]
MANLYNQIGKNKRKTFFLFTIFLAFAIGLGWFISQVYNSPIILYLAVFIAIVMNIIAYWYSDKIVLKMSNAKPADKEKYEGLHNKVENLAITAGLPKPEVYIIEKQQPNAFATGRNPENSVVAVTEGLLKKLNDSELEGVLAHELSHIGNRDMLISTAAVVLVGFISILADMFMRSVFFQALFGDEEGGGGGLMMIVAIVISILAPLGASLIQLAISRKREFLADASGAMLTRYPEGLASALKKISKDSTPMKEEARTTTAHLWIESPFKGRQAKNWFTKLFQTHPPVEERISKLKNIDVQEAN